MVFRMQSWRVMRHLMIVAVFVLFLLVIMVALSFLGLDIAYANQVFKGVYVEGINIGSLSREAAVQKLRDNLDMEALNSDLVLTFGDHTWPLALYQIDAYVDLEATVDKAIAEGKDVPFYKRWVRRATFKGAETSVDLVISYDYRKLESFVSELESTINREPLDAEISLKSGRVFFQRSQEGWVLDSDQARESILQSLRSTDRVASLDIEVTYPDVSDDEIGKVIVVDKTNHTLTLYSDMEVEKQYPVAVGMPRWPTPSGTYVVTSRQKNPTWVNPGTSWATTMPPFIPGGPGNPLGTRALGTSATGVFIHGTYSSGSIGRSVSHGCIRMYIRDSEDIYERVQVGTPVLIF